jgi:hypothetical protein
MGNSCCCTADEGGNTLILDQWGYDDEGVEFNFQYHDTKIRSKGITLGAHDSMLRKCTYPLYLLTIEGVWNELDMLTKNDKSQEEHFKNFRSDTVKYKDFIQHFKMKE